MKISIKSLLTGISLVAALSMTPAATFGSSYDVEWADANESSSAYYYNSPWYGWFYSTDAYGEYWIYSYRQGWQYVWPGCYDDSVYIYDCGTDSWWWTSSYDFPYLYNSTNGAWYYYYGGSNPHRWFYSYYWNGYVTEAQVAAGY